MPPRIPGVQRLGAFNLCLRPAPQATPSLLPLTQAATLTTKEKKRIAKQDPYRWQQMQQRKAAHGTIKQRLNEDRQAVFGDPVRGLQTPFIESFDSAGQSPLSVPRVDDDGNPIEEPHALPTSPHVLNNLVSKEELDDAIKHAYILTKPLDEVDSLVRTDDLAAREETHTRNHAIAVEAINRIVHLENGSAKDRLHANIRRCVETFGRHQTDINLRPKALSRGVEKEERPVRGGPDTGSSEVQIAILTAKIRALANALEKGRGYKDKVGKRDLRLLVHRRQKLLQYMQRKERGSDRWHHMLETLGLSEATWKGQITL
ncbi:ribosomal protein S15 [Seiridium cupressi]